MGKRIETGRKANFLCSECGHQIVVMLAVNADDEAIACTGCGHQAATMGALLDLALKGFASRVAAGLARRKDRLAGRR